MVDLVEMKAIVWEGGELGAKFHDEPIPAELEAKAKEYRQNLLDTAVGVDDAAMEEYFDKGDVSVPTLRGLVVLTVVGMAVTLVFARVDAWVYVVVGGWVLATAVLSWIVLAGLPPKLHDKDKRNETDNELLAAVRAYHEANDSLTDLQFARDKVQGPGDSVMAMQIARAERQRALALSRWRRALERWSPSPGREPRPRNRKGGQHR